MSEKNKKNKWETKKVFIKTWGRNIEKDSEIKFINWVSDEMASILNNSKRTKIVSVQHNRDANNELCAIITTFVKTEKFKQEINK